MSKKFNAALTLIISLLYSIPLFTQNEPSRDTASAEAEKKVVITYAKNNKKEKTVDIYEDEVLKYRLTMNFYDLKNWSIDTKFQRVFYSNGRLKSYGSFLVIVVSSAVWAIPINRHVHYRRNGSVEAVSIFTGNGDAVCDTVFGKNGMIKKIKTYLPGP